MGEVLQLLPDFIADEIIIGVQFSKIVFKGVNILIGKFHFAQLADDVQDVEVTAAGFDRKVFKWFYFFELGTNFSHWHNLLFGNDRDSCIKRDSIQGEIASNPPCSLGHG